MIGVFLDASVLFAACYSEAGSSRDLLREAIRGNVEIVLSEHVLEEARRNLARKAPGALSAFHELLTAIKPQMARKPTLGELRRTAAYIHIKDAPVVAAAVKAKVDCLVTWDRKHFIDDPRVAEKSGLTIITPDQLVATIQGRESR